MKLFLSSYKLGDNPQKLLALLGENTHVGIILNAGDLIDTHDERARRIEKNIKELESLGLTSENIDLRDYFGKTDILRKHLQKFGLVFVKGGNVFVLKRAFEQSGFDKIIHDMLEKDILVYAGESAGSVILGPSIEGLDIVDNSIDIPEGYSPAFSMEGLNIIDYIIAPHYKSNHNESSLVDKLVEYFENKKIPYKTLRDGEVIVVDESKK